MATSTAYAMPETWYRSNPVLEIKDDALCRGLGISKWQLEHIKEFAIRTLYEPKNFRIEGSEYKRRFADRLIAGQPALDPARAPRFWFDRAVFRILSTTRRNINRRASTKASLQAAQQPDRNRQDGSAHGNVVKWPGGATKSIPLQQVPRRDGEASLPILRQRIGHDVEITENTVLDGITQTAIDAGSSGYDDAREATANPTSSGSPFAPISSYTSLLPRHTPLEAVPAPSPWIGAPGFHLYLPEWPLTPDGTVRTGFFLDDDKDEHQPQMPRPVTTILDNSDGDESYNSDDEGSHEESQINGDEDGYTGDEDGYTGDEDGYTDKDTDDEDGCTDDKDTDDEDGYTDDNPNHTNDNEDSHTDD